MTFASSLRRTAHAMRHHPGLHFLGPLWALLRRPYLTTLQVLAGGGGVEVEIAGCRIRVSPEFATWSWETVEAVSYQAFSEAVEPGMVVYDVGAHFGTYSIIALKRSGPEGRVVAYEPHEFTRRYLRKTLEWNDALERTVIRDVCCGATAGIADFYCAPGQAEGMNGLLPVDGFVKETARVTTLDRDVRELNLVPDIIKIDVEGAEWDVLRGAEQTLAEYSPTLFLSVHPNALSTLGIDVGDIQGWLAERSYDWKVIARDHEMHVLARHLGKIS
jgi:FkbM family methyltransferase